MSTVVITGGSRGIGAAAVRLFAARGDRVWFLYEKNHEAAQAVAQQTGAQPICCDVADAAAVNTPKSACRACLLLYELQLNTSTYF